ncbi:MAG TPA: hypothetical protein VFT39_01365 [Vicinamibacterales bacterium]|nr:hypothetical protein [Vicinamibacterales bacterium]
MDSVPLSADERSVLNSLASDLGRVFGVRLRSVVAYGLDTPATPKLLHGLALVDRLAFEDLLKCLPYVPDWRRRSLAIPLILELEEFLRTLDVFPLEYGDIIAHHVLISGTNPFATARVAPADRRRACELSAKSHLIHLREGFLETGGQPDAVVMLIARSAPAFVALLRNIALLTDDDPSDVAGTAERQIRIPADLVREVMSTGAGTRSAIAEPTALLSRYVAASERVWEYVDMWRAHA